MSIIYEALKKVSAAQSSASDDKPKAAVNSNDKIRLGLLCILVLVFGFFCANLIFNAFVKPPQTKSRMEKPIKVYPAIKQESATSQAPASPIPPVSSPEPLPAASAEIRPIIQVELILNGVFFSEDEGYALINNQIVKEGDLISGATVKQITLDEVELEAGGQPVKLHTR